ncbi:hypothetical protein S83_003661, partial [Arachis hypogaea]
KQTKVNVPKEENLIQKCIKSKADYTPCGSSSVTLNRIFVSFYNSLKNQNH